MSFRFFVSALALGALFALAGCGGGTGDNPNGGKAFNNSTGQGTSSGTTTTTGGTTGGSTGVVTSPTPTLGAGCANSGTDVLCLTISAATSSLLADGTSTSAITGTLTKNGSPLSNVILTFGLTNAAMGSLLAANGVTNSSGQVSTTFQAGRTIGAVGVSVAEASSSASNTVILALTQAPGNTAAGIQFITASQSVLGIVGSGQPTSSAVTFKVTDSGGQAVPNQLVAFSLVGPTGAYIGPSDATPTATTGTTDSAGLVSVPLNAGNVAGPVTITATVTVAGAIFSSSTSVVSIGGGVPSAKWFSIATKRFNLPGLVLYGFENDMTVYVADRFSNYNILQGTQVSFFTEAGAIDRSVSLDNTGAGTVKIRTQDPRPYRVPATHPFYPNALGWVTVIAVTRGEEEFVDVNGNGVYDPGIDTFTAAMDLTEPYLDANDNGVWDGPGCTQAGCDPTHPGEFFFDSNQNFKFDVANGVWDGPACTQAGCIQSPTIWKAMLLQFTGNVICSVTPQTAWVVPNAGSRDFTITIRDSNNNVPVPDVTLATIQMSDSTGSRTDIGTGNINLKMADGISAGPFTYTFTLADNSPTINQNSATGFRITVTAPAAEAVQTCPDLNGLGVVQ